MGPILALRGARHGILLGLLLNGTSAEMRTCKGEGGGGRGLVHAAPHRASVPPRGLATTAVFLLGAQHWLGSCLFLFLFFWPMSSSRNGCVYCASVESMLRLCFHMRVCAWVCVCVDPGQMQTKYFFLRVECVGRRLHHPPTPPPPPLSGC